LFNLRRYVLIGASMLFPIALVACANSGQAVLRSAPSNAASHAQQGAPCTAPPVQAVQVTTNSLTLNFGGTASFVACAQFAGDFSLVASPSGIVSIPSGVTPVVDPNTGIKLATITVSGLAPGTAAITVTDKKGNTATVAVTVTGTIDVPSTLGSQTQAFGVNNSGQIVGRYVDSGGTSHGFLLSGGSFTTIDVPGAGAFGTTANGINNSGQIVGFYNVGSNIGSSGYFYGFSLSGDNFTTGIQYSNTYHTYLWGINDGGAIVGFCSTNQSFAAACPTFLGIGPGFILSGIGGTFTLVNASSLGACREASVGSDAEGINNAGEVVGGWEDCGGGEHGYVLAGGTYTDIDVPGNSGSTLAHGINNLGQIVGWTRNIGFLLSGGSYTTFNIPGATTTSAQGINDSGEIVGFYQDASNNFHGFLTLSRSLPMAVHRKL
jgi:probable HAF family extracellular repeat protein